MILFLVESVFSLLVVIGVVTPLVLLRIVQFEKVDDGCGCGEGIGDFYGWKMRVGRLSFYLTIKEGRKLGWENEYYDFQVFLPGFVIEWEK